MKTAQISSIHQQGSTLIEILVSMFILALGLMALIAMQTRTSIGIKEAENRTIIAQATENLAENMMTNPHFKLSGGAKDYTAYGSSFDCGNKNANPVPPNGTVTGAAGSQALVTYHLADFYKMACNVGGLDTNTKVSVTIDKQIDGKTVSGQVLHITWTMGGSSGKPFTYDYPLDDNI